MDKKVIYTKKDIAASLEYGARISTPGVVVAWSSLILGICSFFCFFGIILFDSDEAMELTIVFFIIGFLSLSFGGYLLIREYRLNQKIKLYLQDAVHLEAKCSEMGSWSGVHATAYKILVRFRYDGKRRTMYSGRRKEGKEMTEGGFAGIYHSYAGQIIDILYSPKYDQVMLLRLPKKKRRRKSKEAKQKSENQK